MALITRIPPPPLRPVVEGVSVASGMCMFRALVDYRHRAAILPGRAHCSNTLICLGCMTFGARKWERRWVREGEFR